MFSCVSTYERQKIKAEKFYLSNPKDLAKICANEFPVKDIFIKGDDKIVSDTIYRTDTVFTQIFVNGETKYIKTPCPVNKTITNTVYRVDTVKIERTDKLKVVTDNLNATNDLLEKEKQSLTKAKNTKNIFMYISIGLFLLIIAGIAYLIKSKMKVI